MFSISNDNQVPHHVLGGGGEWWPEPILNTVHLFYFEN